MVLQFSVSGNKINPGFKHFHSYNDKIRGVVPDDEKSIEDMQEEQDYSDRVRNERLEKHRDKLYLWSILDR